MKKLLILVSAIVFVFGLSGVSDGASYKITDEITFDETTIHGSGDPSGWGGQYANKLEHAGDYVQWTHEYDFDPPADTILSAELEIYLRDDENDTYRLKTWEFAIGWGEDQTWDIGGVDTGAYVFDLNVDFLADGSFTINLMSLWGDFFIDYSKLTIDYESYAASVPDSSIMFLLGPSLIVLGICSRRKLRRKS